MSDQPGGCQVEQFEVAHSAESLAEIRNKNLKVLRASGKTDVIAVPGTLGALESRHGPSGVRCDTLIVPGGVGAAFESKQVLPC